MLRKKSGVLALRALPYVVGGAGLYAIGLTGLSRLLAEPATDAGW